MNKLVSKDPIQRFKQGKKIIKAQGGTTTPNLPVLASQYKSLPNPVSTVTKSSGLLSRVGGIVGRYLPAFLLASDIESRRQQMSDQIKQKQAENSVGVGTQIGANAMQNAIDDQKRQKYLDRQKQELDKQKQTIQQSLNKQNPKPATSTKESGSSGNSFRSAFDAARNANEKEFTWNGKRYNTRRSGETEDQWLSNITKGKIAFTAPTDVDDSGIEKAKEIVETPNNPVNFGYRSNFNYTNGNIKNLGFNNYQGLVNHVRANPNDPFSQDLTARWGDVNTWDQQKFENAYRIGGYYGNMNMRRLLNGQAQWAGENDARYDAREAAYGRQVSQPQQYNDGWKQALTFSYRKQGGQLVSKNPIQRFKQKSFKKEAKFPR